MRIAIIGASGSIGTVLVPYLLEHSEHTLILFSRHASAIAVDAQYETRVTRTDGDALNAHDVSSALRHCDMAVYLVHLMGNRQLHGNFRSAEEHAAHTFAEAIKKYSIKRVVYVGGMGQDDKNLTQHLKSRQQTGAIIRALVPQLIELRTPMVIGSEAAGYEVIRLLVTRLPVIPLPKWSKAVTQPITVTDVARYITAAIQFQGSTHLTVDIGGPEQLSYAEVAKRYAAYKHKNIHLVTLPFAPKRIVATVFRWFNNKSLTTVADMIESAEYSAVLKDNEAAKLFPTVTPEPIDRAFS